MFEKNIPLSRYSNYQIGGKAKYFLLSSNAKKISAGIKEAKKLKLPFFILGGGTNILFSDSGYNGLIIKPDFKELEIISKNQSEVLVKVGASVPFKDLVAFAISNRLSGLEWAGGLPGTVGGAIWGNAGAFGGETKDNVLKVISLDINNGIQVVERSFSELNFGYRNSLFKNLSLAGTPEVILAAVFRFSLGEKDKIEEAVNAKIRYRQSRQPLEYPNIGSIFKNIDLKLVPKEVAKKFKNQVKTDPFPVLPVAALIDAAGLKGVSFGGAMISPKHPNFIVNVLSAKASDVCQLIKLVKSEIKARYKVNLENEVILL